MTMSQELFSATLPQELWTAQQVRENEAQAAASTGISMPMLMERAGHSAFALLKQLWPQAQSILVLAGKGNNGGDAYVLARLAKQAAYKVQLVHIGDANAVSGDAAQAQQRWLDCEGEIETPEQADVHLDVIVDGILGTGLSGPVSESIAHIIERCNYSTSPILALDIPTGLNADTGALHGLAIQAAACITFVGVKQGLCTGYAAQYCGELYFSGLGIEQAFKRQVQSDKQSIEYQSLRHLLAPRSRHAHKGDFGHVALVGGNQDMPGAIRLAAEACLRAGTGLLSVLTHSKNRVIISAGRPEFMLQGLKEADEQSMLKVCALFERISVIGIGPGLGSDLWAERLMQAALAQNKTMVVDADALNYLAAKPQVKHNWVLTPHPGEAARLLACSTRDIAFDRYAAAKALQQAYGGVVVLKGRGTIICSEDQLSVANVGNPGMASGGMGDLLSGIIAALLAQGMSLFDAACLGVCVHGGAADMAAEQGERGMLASDLLPYIRNLVN